MEELTRNQQRAIPALLTEPTITAAAEQVGVTARTLHKWLLQPDFIAAYKEAKREAMGAAIGRLQMASDKAVKTLEEVMQDKEATAASRVTAARTVLELALKATEIEEIEERLLRLEERAEEYARTQAHSWAG